MTLEQTYAAVEQATSEQPLTKDFDQEAQQILTSPIFKTAIALLMMVGGNKVAAVIAIIKRVAEILYGSL